MMFSISMWIVLIVAALAGVLALALLAMGMNYSFRRRKRHGCAVIEELEKEAGYVSGRELTLRLERRGIRISYFRFYSVCNDLRNAGCVSMQEETDADGRKRSFRIEPDAREKWRIAPPILDD